MSRKKLLVSLFGIVLLAVFFGCSDDKVIDDNAVKLYQSDTGSTQKVNVSDIIQIKLNSNPSTGYKWEIETCDTSILEPQKQEYEASNPGDKRPGMGGTSALRFKAIAAGQTLLKLIYRRPGDKEEPSKYNVFEITIIVQ